MIMILKYNKSTFIILMFITYILLYRNIAIAKKNIKKSKTKKKICYNLKTIDKNFPRDLNIYINKLDYNEDVKTLLCLYSNEKYLMLNTKEARKAELHALTAVQIVSCLSSTFIIENLPKDKEPEYPIHLKNIFENISSILIDNPFDWIKFNYRSENIKYESHDFSSFDCKVLISNESN